MQEKIPEINPFKDSESSYSIGQKVHLESLNGDTTEFEVVNILDSKKASTTLGLTYDIKNPVPILIVDKEMKHSLASYHPEIGVIFATNDTPPQVMLHEIIHSLELGKKIPDELNVFYERVLEVLPDSTHVEPNFRKNIHEFIADAYSKEGFKQTLKTKGLYDEFENLTKYIFE